MYLGVEMNGSVSLRRPHPRPHADLTSADWRALQSSLAKGEPVQLDGKSLTISEVIGVAL
jgi:hypothetical protein